MAMIEISAEDIVMNLVMHGGDARSLAIEAMRFARQNDFAKAESLLTDAQKALNEAHNFQTDLIQSEMGGGDPVRVSLLMVHGQDHLMNAMTVLDLAAEIVALNKQLHEQGSI